MKFRKSEAAVDHRKETPTRRPKSDKQTRSLKSPIAVIIGMMLRVNLVGGNIFWILTMMNNSFSFHGTDGVAEI